MPSYAQKAVSVRSALRKLRAVYRASDTAGEKVERELDRLINRKTLVESKSLQTVQSLLAEMIRRVNIIPQAFDDAARIASS